jgi:hypothetical protein
LPANVPDIESETAVLKGENVEAKGGRDLADVFTAHLLQYCRFAGIVESSERKLSPCSREQRHIGTDTMSTRHSRAFKRLLRMMVSSPIC